MQCSFNRPIAVPREEDPCVVERMQFNNDKLKGRSDCGKEATFDGLRAFGAEGNQHPGCRSKPQAVLRDTIPTAVVRRRLESSSEYRQDTGLFPMNMP